jgi:hypothetical protein
MVDADIARDALAVVLDVTPRRDVILRAADEIFERAARDDYGAFPIAEQLARSLDLDPSTASPAEISSEIRKALGEQS